MALSGWDAKYSVNQPVMDKDHQKLIEMISLLHTRMKEGKSKTILSPLLDDMTHYAENHFSREEKYLAQMGSSELSYQKEQHSIFLGKVHEFQDAYEKGNMALAVQLLPFLNNWFLQHIMKIDMKYKK